MTKVDIDMPDLSRRLFLTRAAAFIAAPAIVRVTSLMPISAQREFVGIVKGVTFTPVPKHLWPGISRWWALEYMKETAYSDLIFDLHTEVSREALPGLK